MKEVLTVDCGVVDYGIIFGCAIGDFVNAQSITVGVGVVLPPGFAVFWADVRDKRVGKLGSEAGIEAKEVVVRYNIVKTLEPGCGGYISA